MALKILAEQVHYANVDLNHNQLNNARIQNLSAEPSSNNAAGRIFYDTDTNQLKVYNGSAFEQLVTETTDSNDITAVESILNASLVIGRDAHNQIQFSTDNEIHFKTNNETPVIKMKASGEIEATSLDISGNIDIDGTANLDVVDIDGEVNFAALDHVMQDGANINDPSDNLLIGFTTNKVTIGSPAQFDSTLTIASDIIHKQDTNNKISFGTDTQSFETGGTARINISDSGLQIGSGARVTTIEDNDSLGTSDTKLATQGNIKAYVDANTGSNITSLGVISQDSVVFTSANANDPVVIIKNTTNDANAGRLKFLKDKGAAAADNDEIGEILFAGDDAAQVETDFGKIFVQVGEADNTDEAGKMTLQVASSDGTTTGLTSGLVLTGHKTSNYVDVTLGSGASSTVTIPGNLVVTGETTTVNVTTTTTSNGVVFEGTTGDGHDGTLKSVVAGADVTYTLPNATGHVALFAADPSTTTISSTPDELNLIDGDTSRGTTAVADGDGFLHNDGGTMRMTNVSKLADLFAGTNITASSSVLSVADAADDTKGVVELATTAEALAGSDSDRAVTPAGLAARSFAASIGDGSATGIAVDHNLNTRDVIVQLYDVSSYDTVIADVVRTTVDRVTITFASAPSSNDIRVLVTKID